MCSLKQRFVDLFLLKTVSVAYFQRNVKLSGFSVYPEISPPKLIRISGVLLCMIKIKNRSLESRSPANVEVPFRQVSRAVVRVVYTVLPEFSWFCPQIQLVLFPEFIWCCLPQFNWRCLQNSIEFVSRIQLALSPEFNRCCVQNSVGVVSVFTYVFIALLYLPWSREMIAFLITLAFKTFLFFQWDGGLWFLYNLNNISYNLFLFYTFTVVQIDILMPCYIRSMY
jgi:hypothetical protein